MAIGWFTVLQAVPWADVISNAPKVAEGAKKLWNSVGKKSVPPVSVNASATQAMTPAALVDARLAATEAAVLALNEQMIASSALIRDLAEQNGQLVRRVDANWRKARWLCLASGIVGAVLAVGLMAMRAVAG
ncbi:hypothetical protein [Actimicrobium sp. CCI2.3]|uniref:hypothetical protein n=1 Tax=Actimicrobium sp. CCI2.3 TaxID=3048616 RepID=UPI002AB42B14|nr:hypothetical protein [Actimicrobium sp. CCI2.3]MDY7573019.1 hypothetical protein [Actimicrobium sp. CCI2.3]MEB0020816.1 hypothetical protein [Actimicrobium sp. CCI2.3]